MIGRYGERQGLTECLMVRTVATSQRLVDLKKQSAILPKSVIESFIYISTVSSRSPIPFVAMG